MANRRVVYAVELISRDGVRLECDRDGWRVLGIRQLGEATKAVALELLARAEALTARAADEPAPPDALLHDCERVAVRLGLRVTHRRAKQSGR